MFSINFYHRTKSKDGQEKVSGPSKKRRIVKFVALPFLAFVALLLAIFAGYSIVFAHKYYSNQFLGGVDIGGKTIEAAKGILDPKISAFLDQPIVLTYKKDGQEDKPYEIKPRDIGLQYDLDKSLDDTWKYGHKNGPFLDLWQQLKSIFIKNKSSLSHGFDREVLNQKINFVASELDLPEKDYSIIYENGHFSLTSVRKIGARINQDEIKAQIEKQIPTLDNAKIAFGSKTYEPQIDKAKAESRLNQANKILSGGPITLAYSSQTFSLDKETIGAILISRPNGDDLEIIYNEENLKTYISGIARSIDVDPQNAALKISDGKATVFRSSVVGKKVDQSQLKIDIENALFARIVDNGSVNTTKVAVKVAETQPEIGDDAISSLGIVDLVGTGTTDFKNSPANRTHNIQVGTTAINGTLLKPGETFSTLGHLGKIDASGGYLPELVIKDNTTTPEYGGGLCQVSTTLFRAATSSGLRIDQRQNHKYRVSYYEPPVGMDATIYDPAPDFKFTNTYSSHILIQGSITGTKITFEMYGTKDGRTVEISTPQIIETTDPPAPAYVETDTLAPGEKKLIEKAHQGAKVSFSYKVTQNGKTLQEKVFQSLYVPWQEKWLIGKGAVPIVNPPAPETPLTPDTPQPATP